MSPKSFEAVWLKFAEMNLAKNFASRREILSRFPSRSHFYFGHQGSCRDSWKHPSKILAAKKLLLGKNLDEIRGRASGFSLPGENPGEILAAKIFASWQDSRQDRGEILATGNFASWQESCRDPTERKNPGGQNLAAIPAGFPSRSQRAPVQIPVLISHRLD